MPRTRTRSLTPSEDRTDLCQDLTHSAIDRETLPMHQAIAPIAVRPWTLNGLSERLLVSHYEHHYGSAVRTLNAVRSELATLDAGAPDYQLGALKREELATMAPWRSTSGTSGTSAGKGTRSRIPWPPPSS